MKEKGATMDLLSGSGIILLVCVLIGLGLVLRRRSTGNVTTIGAEKFVADIVESHVSESSYSSSQATPAEEPAAHITPTQAPVFRPKLGRIVLFVLGLVLLVAALVTGIFSLFTAVTALVPLLLLVGGLACFVSLRVLAIRDRDRKRARTLLALEKRQAQAGPSHSSASSSIASKQQAHAAPVVSTIELKAAPERPARARQQMPVSHAAKALRKAKTQHHSLEQFEPALSLEPEAGRQGTSRRLRMEDALPDTSWQVTQLPLPTYLEAESVHREAPAPVKTDQEMSSQTQTLAEAATLNLDDVLKRRRA